MSDKLLRVWYEKVGSSPGTETVLMSQGWERGGNAMIGGRKSLSLGHYRWIWMLFLLYSLEVSRETVLVHIYAIVTGALGLKINLRKTWVEPQICPVTALLVGQSHAFWLAYPQLTLTPAQDTHTHISVCAFSKEQLSTHSALSAASE